METAINNNDALSDDGEILEDGEIDDEEINETVIESEEVVREEEEVTEAVNDEDEANDSEGDEEQKKRKKSHHRRRRKKHDDHKVEEKRSRHKKRKGEDASEGNDSPPSKRKKKRKKHSKDKKERESTSPEADAPENNHLSESPPLPSEQTAYNYASYDTTGVYDGSEKYIAAYDPTDPYTDASNTYPYDAYGQEAQYSSGSDSCYSDFESHLKQYQNYKQNSDTKPSASALSDDEDDDDNYYSVGYDAEKRRKRQRTRDDSVTSYKRASARGKSGSRNNEERRKPEMSRKSQGSRDRQLKGDKYNHQQSTRRSRNSRKFSELCQNYYLNGFCPQKEKCNYMHDIQEYPCKYFHTGTQCLNGENCKFSHEAANPSTERIIKQFQDAYNNADDSKEIEALEKVGIKPLQKPPPGMGLLPTPPPGSTMLPSKGGRSKSKPAKSSIPSLFDISVKPTRELQQKIDANSRLKVWKRKDDLMRASSVASLHDLADDAAMEIDPLTMPPPMFDASQSLPRAGLLPLPNIGNTNILPPIATNYAVSHSLLGSPPRQPAILPTPVPARVPPPVLPPGSATPPWILRQQALLQQEQEEALMQYEQYHPAISPEHVRINTMQSQVAKDEENNKENSPLTGFSAVKNDRQIKPDAMNQESEDIIRMDDHSDVIKEHGVQAPSFLPPKQKALFMRIRQKGDLASPAATKTSSNRWDVSSKEITSDNWTYSSDEEEVAKSETRTTGSSSETVQSIIHMISNKKNDKTSVVDTNLLSKVANVINLSPNSAASTATKHNDYTGLQQTSDKSMTSPRHYPHHHQPQIRERKSSGSDSSTGHHTQQRDPLRRRLSTSDLNKEPVTIPLVAKQNADPLRTTHPDPRLTFSRLFGKTKSEFRSSAPSFGKDLMMPGSGKMHGLKITLSSSGDSVKSKTNGDKRVDPRLLQSQTRPRVGDPRAKTKPNDPRLRGRSTSITKNSPPRLSTMTSKSAAVPPKPTALLTKPSSSIIPSLPELNLDLANIVEHKPKPTVPPVSPATTTPGDPLARLPRLLRGSARSAANRMSSSASERLPPKLPISPTIAPYDPRYIPTPAADVPAKLPVTETTTKVSVDPAPYDPRVINNQLSSVPPLFDPRSSNQDPIKPIAQLPKLTPAPGYAAKFQETNGDSRALPSGEAEDF